LQQARENFTIYKGNIVIYFYAPKKLDLSDTKYPTTGAEGMLELVVSRMLREVRNAYRILTRCLKSARPQ
jgi:hypothetical protein